MLTIGLRLVAVVLANPNHESVHVVEDLSGGDAPSHAHAGCSVGCAIGQKCSARNRRKYSVKSALEKRAQFLVSGMLGCDLVARGDPVRVSIDDKHGVLAGVQENRVGSLWPNAVEPEQLLPQGRCFLQEHASERAAVVGIQEADEAL